MGVLVLDAGVFSPHSLQLGGKKTHTRCMSFCLVGYEFFCHQAVYMSSAEIRHLLYPWGREEVVRKARGGGGNETSIMSRIFLVI